MKHLLFLKFFEEVKERFLSGVQACSKLAFFFQNLLDFVLVKFLVFLSLRHHLVQNPLKPIHHLTLSPGSSGGAPHTCSSPAGAAFKTAASTVASRSLGCTAACSRWALWVAAAASAHGEKDPAQEHPAFIGTRLQRPRRRPTFRGRCLRPASCGLSASDAGGAGVRRLPSPRA